MGVSDWGDAGFGEVGAEVSGAGAVVLFLYERAGQCAWFVALPFEQRGDDTDWMVVTGGVSTHVNGTAIF